jgi:hypothetical protein
MAVQHQQAARLEAAHRQPRERLREEAARWERPLRRVDPDHRLVTAALERRGEAARRARKTAEAASTQRLQPTEAEEGARAPEVRAAFLAMGRTLPALGPTDLLAPPQRQTLLRGLMATGVGHRAPRDEVQTRLVWTGGATTTLAVPITVGACADLQGAAAMAPQMLTRFAAGHTDAAIAPQRTPQGDRSPQRPQGFPRTVRTSRLKHGLMPQRHPSPPRHGAGSLTVPQRARRLGVSPHGLYARLAKGQRQRAPEPATGL